MIELGWLDAAAATEVPATALTRFQCFSKVETPPPAASIEKKSASRAYAKPAGRGYSSRKMHIGEWLRTATQIDMEKLGSVIELIRRVVAWMRKEI